MTLTGCIVQGVGVFLYLGDEGMATGASWTIEVVIWTACSILFNFALLPTSPLPAPCHAP